MKAGGKWAQKVARPYPTGIAAADLLVRRKRRPGWGDARHRGLLPRVPRVWEKDAHRLGQHPHDPRWFPSAARGLGRPPAASGAGNGRQTGMTGARKQANPGLGKKVPVAFGPRCASWFLCAGEVQKPAGEVCQGPAITTEENRITDTKGRKQGSTARSPERPANPGYPAGQKPPRFRGSGPTGRAARRGSGCPGGATGHHQCGSRRNMSSRWLGACARRRVVPPSSRLGLSRPRGAGTSRTRP